MFKVGDLIIGNQRNNYMLTNEKSICKVTAIESRILIKVVIVKVLNDYAPAIRAMNDKEEFSVYASSFDLCFGKKNNTSW